MLCTNERLMASPEWHGFKQNEQNHTIDFQWVVNSAIDENRLNPVPFWPLPPSWLESHPFDNFRIASTARAAHTLPMRQCPKCEELRKQLRHLEDRLQLLQSKPALQRGFLGERIVAKVVNGVLTAFNESHDVIAARGGILIEVKYSNLNSVLKVGPTKRWNWANAKGISGKKVYHRLLLVGDRDPDVTYSDSDDCPYVFFDVPFDDVDMLMEFRKDKLIQITTNPRPARAPAARLLFTDYIVTESMLKWRYGI